MNWEIEFDEKFTTPVKSVFKPFGLMKNKDFTNWDEVKEFIRALISESTEEVKELNLTVERLKEENGVLVMSMDEEVEKEKQRILDLIEGLKNEI